MCVWNLQWIFVYSHFVTHDVVIAFHWFVSLSLSLICSDLFSVSRVLLCLCQSHFVTHDVVITFHWFISLSLSLICLDLFSASRVLLFQKCSWECLWMFIVHFTLRFGSSDSSWISSYTVSWAISDLRFQEISISLLDHPEYFNSWPSFYVPMYLVIARYIFPNL